MKLFRKYLILSHRYVGIALGLLIVMWFASGMVMIYAGGMPRVTLQDRLDRSPNLDLSQVRLTPSDAARRAELANPDRAKLTSVMDRPAYRFSGWGSGTVFADTGEVLEDLSVEQARTVASHFVNVPEDRVHFERTLTKIDQWTLTQGRQMPLHKFRVDDPNRTEVYVQPRTGEVTMLTTQKSRALAWAGTIPHWLYFLVLRNNQPIWYEMLVWTSGLACVLAVMGLILGVTQFRRTRPFRLSAAIPYAGWMRWHYITGVVFGTFTLTWAFSGLLSMEPFAWTQATGLNVRDDVFTGGRIDLPKFAAMDPATWDRVLGGRAIKEVEFVRIQDQHYYLVRQAPDKQAAPEQYERLHAPYPVNGQNEPDRVLVAADTLEIRNDPFTVESLMARIEKALPDVPIQDHQLLSDYDSYYYSRARQTPLPVLRVRFNDPAETWVYIDPEMSQPLAAVHRLARVERWLYSGLHNLDFSFWYDKRPLWDIAMIVLSLGGLMTTAIGLCLGVKRTWRKVAGPANAWADRPAAPEPQSAIPASVQLMKGSN